MAKLAKKSKSNKNKKSEFSQLPKKKPTPGVLTPKAAEAPKNNYVHSGPASLPAVKELFAASQREAALKMLGELKEISLADIALLREIGHFLMSGQDFDSAAAIYRKWTELEPENASAFNSLGASLVSGGWEDAAQGALLKASMLEPGKPIYQFNLAKLYMVKNAWDAARSLLLNIVHTHPAEASKAKELLAQFPEGNTSVIDMAVPVRPVSPEITPSVLAEAKPFSFDPPKRNIKGVLCCLPGLDNFVDDLIAGLKPQVSFEKCVSNDLPALTGQIQKYDTVWLEWGNELAEILTNKAAELLKNKRVILRIHRYELYSGMLNKMNYRVVDDIILVSPYMKSLFLKQVDNSKIAHARVHVLYNGVDLSRFKMKTKPFSYNLAYVGYIHSRKDPISMLNAAQWLFSLDSRYQLHIAGTIEDSFYDMAMRHYIESNSMQDKVFFHGWQTDVANWLQDKDVIISTSLSEGHPVGVMEAMACGLKPVIYSFPGAHAMYPKKFIWNNFSELVELLKEEPSPPKYREFVEKNYSLAIQLERLRKIILDEQVVEATPFLY